MLKANNRNNEKSMGSSDNKKVSRVIGWNRQLQDRSK